MIDERLRPVNPVGDQMLRPEVNTAHPFGRIEVGRAEESDRRRIMTESMKLDCGYVHFLGLARIGLALALPFLT